MIIILNMEKGDKMRWLRKISGKQTNVDKSIEIIRNPKTRSQAIAGAISDGNISLAVWLIICPECVIDQIKEDKK